MPLPIKEIDWPSSLTDYEWDKIQKELPSPEESEVHQHLANRDSLIDVEKQQRSDHVFRQNCSSTVQKACHIVDHIRDEERKTIWNSEIYDESKHESRVVVFPGMLFSQAKGLMEMTKLWQIVKRMPKGALLHAHLDAMVDLDFLLDLLLSTPGMHIYSTTALTNTAELELAPIKFRFLKSSNNEVNQSMSIWTNDYIPDTPIPVVNAADSFPNGGRPVFLKWLRSRCSITQRESEEQFRGVDDIWKKFSSIFPILDTIFFYEPIFRLCLRRIMTQLLADSIRWVDLRLAFVFHYYREGREEPESDFNHLFKVFDEELRKFQASEGSKEFWGFRIIWTSRRRLDSRKIIDDMGACIATKIAYPHLISGYDLVGQEDPGRTLKDLLPELLWFKRRCAQEDIEIPFFFHAGECLGDGSETDQNLFDAILLGTRRIGHGFSLYKHPLLVDLVKQNKILIESCPISNEVLRLCSSINSHPLPALIARGVPCSLSNDDPAILGQDSTGLTYDFWQALQGWDNLGLAGLGSLAENSIRWAIFEDENMTNWLKGIEEDSVGTSIKAVRLQQWRDEWEQFCHWIVNEFRDTQS